MLLICSGCPPRKGSGSSDLERFFHLLCLSDATMVVKSATQIRNAADSVRFIYQ